MEHIGDPSALAPPPGTENEIRQAADRLGLPILDACMPGVVTNLGLLRRHAEAMLGDGPRAGW